MLVRSHRQEALAQAYVQIIAAQCGLTWSLRKVDYGIDFTLYSVRNYNGRYAESGHRLDLQLKSFTVAERSNDVVVFDLDVKNYNDLRMETLPIPRILVVLELPSDETEWTVQSHDALSIRWGAYWISLRGLPRTTNKRVVRIRLPRENLFAAQSVFSLFERIEKGELI